VLAPTVAEDAGPVIPHELAPLIRFHLQPLVCALNVEDIGHPAATDAAPGLKLECRNSG
jgi:hypothetical protein